MVDEKLLRKPVPGISPNKLLNKSMCNRLHKEAMAAYPNECVGYVKDKKYHQLVNISKKPAEEVRLSKEDHLLLAEVEPDVIFHSHPGGPDCSSGQDMVWQEQTAVPHAITSTDGKACLPVFLYGDMVEKEPLLGRGFRYAWQDCYDIVRDFHKVVFDRHIINFPREWEWWDRKVAKEGGMYVDNFRKAGFVQYQSGLEIDIGDVILMKVNSFVSNHSGVYVGDGLMLHHLTGRMESDPSRLSVIEPVSRWMSGGRVTHFLRYEG